MLRFFKSILLSCLIILTLGVNAYAADNIQLINADDSNKDIVVKAGDKLMLDKTWYSQKFEINPTNAQGDRKMLAVDQTEYRTALNEVNFPLAKVGAYKVYFLDYRLEDYASAMALTFKDDSTVVLGTYYPYSKSTIHQLAVHELGHQVDFQLMDSSKWETYKKLRGITDSSIYNNYTDVYENRPQEIFADDFRLLLGDEEAREAEHLNTKLPNPESVPGLKEFFLSLAK
jgi:hypothetical protein